MAAKSTSTVPAIVKKALAESNKSNGMRMLFDAGKTVTEVRDIFGAPYGYVYGVALRHGVVDTAANRRAPRKTQAQKTKAVAAKKATATKASTASTRTAKPAPRAKTTTKRAVAARPNLSKAAKTRVASAR